MYHELVCGLFNKIGTHWSARLVLLSEYHRLVDDRTKVLHCTETFVVGIWGHGAMQSWTQGDKGCQAEHGGSQQSFTKTGLRFTVERRSFIWGACLKGDKDKSYNISSMHNCSPAPHHTSDSFWSLKPTQHLSSSSISSNFHTISNQDHSMTKSFILKCLDNHNLTITHQSPPHIVEAVRRLEPPNIVELETPCNERVNRIRPMHLMRRQKNKGIANNLHHW